MNSRPRELIPFSSRPLKSNTTRVFKIQGAIFTGGKMITLVR